MTERTLAAVARALEARADSPGVFSGYASLFGVTDTQGDVVERGAFRATLEAWRIKERRPAMLWQHDPNAPIGLWTHLEEDAVGLRVEGRLLLSVQAGAEAHEHLKMGTGAWLRARLRDGSGPGGPCLACRTPAPRGRAAGGADRASAGRSEPAFCFSSRSAAADARRPALRPAVSARHGRLPGPRSGPSWSRPAGQRPGAPGSGPGSSGSIS